MKHRSTLPLLSFLGVFLLLGLALYAPVLFGGKALYFRDVYHNYYTQLHFMKQSLWRGELPFWNPWLFAGTPQMALLEPPLFYPPGWIFFTALPFQFALVGNLLIHQLLAGLGFYYLGQHYQWSWRSSWLSALFFSFSGLMASLHSFHPLQNTLAWLPLIWWAFAVCLHSPSRRAVVTFALFYALQILSGHLEIVYFETGLLLLYGIGFAFFPVDAEQPVSGRSRLRSLLNVGLACVLGIGLSALQWWPALAFLPETVRAQGLGSDTMTWSYHPFLSLLLWLPDYFNLTVKGLSLHQFWGEPLYAKMPFFISGYVGLFPLLLLLTGFSFIKVQSQRRRVMFFGLIALLLLMMAWGKHFPLYPLLGHLPGMGFFRYPSKLLVFASFSLCLAAGYVLQEFWENAQFLKRFGWVALGSALACVMAGMAFLNAETPILTQLTPKFWTGAALVALAGLWAFVQVRKPTPFAPHLLMALLSLDLLLNGWAALPLAPSAQLFEAPSPPAQVLLQKQLPAQTQARMLLAAGSQVWVPASFAPDWNDSPELRFNAFHHASLQNNYSLAWGFRNAFGEWAGLGTKALTMHQLYLQSLALKKPHFRQVYESLLGVRYVLSLTPDEATEAYYRDSGNYRKIQAFPELQLTLWENLKPLPRARFHYQSMAIKDPAVIPALLAEPQQKSGIDFRSRVILNDDAALAQARAQVPSVEAQNKRWKGPEIIKEKSNRIFMTFETNTSGYLVLADQALPGWQAKVNGQATPILTADFFLKAIRVGPGQHQIVLTYHPPGFTEGCTLSFLSVLVWLGLLVSSLYRRQGNRVDDVFDQGPA